MQPRLEHGDPIDIYHTGHARRVCLRPHIAWLGMVWNQHFKTLPNHAVMISDVVCLNPLIIFQPQLANVLVPCHPVLLVVVFQIRHRSIRIPKDWLFLTKHVNHGAIFVFFFLLWLGHGCLVSVVYAFMFRCLIVSLVGWIFIRSWSMLLDLDTSTFAFMGSRRHRISPGKNIF